MAIKTWDGFSETCLKGKLVVSGPILMAMAKAWDQWVSARNHKDWMKNKLVVYSYGLKVVATAFSIHVKNRINRKSADLRFIRFPI